MFLYLLESYQNITIDLRCCAVVPLMTAKRFVEFLKEEKCHPNITFHQSHRRLPGFFGEVIDGRTCIMIDDVSFGLGFLCSLMCDLE